MIFQRAQVTDMSEIIKINRSFLKKNLKNDKNGFLLGERTEDYIKEKISHYYVTKGGDNRILGYLELDYHIGDENFAEGKWENTKLKEKVLSHIKNKTYIYLIQIAVKTQRRGIGNYLINELSKTFEKSILISFVALKPHFNEVSLNFHLKYGFLQVGKFTMRSKFGITDYERICLIK